MVLTKSEVTAILDEHGLEPSRALGQNFVVDPNLVRKIARLSGAAEGGSVVEIGAGLGCLTLALLETGAAVTAIEIDRYLIPPLRANVEHLGAKVIHADATEVDWPNLLDPEAGPWSLVANLPYNVATPLLLDLLADAPHIDRFLVMVQLEVAERMAALPGTRAAGLPSIGVAYYGSARIASKIGPEVFLPRPRVDSALLAFERHAEPVVDQPLQRILALARPAFGQRRKMLRRSLGGSVAPEAFETAGVAPTARPEELTIQQWSALAAAVAGE